MSSVSAAPVSARLASAAFSTVSKPNAPALSVTRSAAAMDSRVRFFHVLLLLFLLYLLFWDNLEKTSQNLLLFFL